MATTYADIASLAETSVATTLKQVYTKAVELVPEFNPLTAQFEKTTKVKAVAGNLYFNAKTETGGAVANVDDGRLLPRATSPVRKTGYTGLVHTYTVITVGGQAAQLTQDSRSAFVATLADNLEDGLVRVRNDVERQYNGDSRGILCYLETVAAAPTHAAQYPFGDTTSTQNGTVLLIEGMDVVFINPATGAERGRNKISSIDTAADTFTLAGAIAGAVIGDYVSLCNDSGATAAADKDFNYLGESNGILGAVKSGDTFENIAGGTVGRWNAVVMGNSGTKRTITEKLIAQLEARVRAKCGKKVSIFYTSRGIQIELADQLAGLRRLEPGPKLKGGIESVTINNQPMIVGDFCPKNMFFAINTDSDVVAMVDAVKMGYVDLDGAKLHRVEGRHAWRADLWFPHNAIWFQRNAHGVLQDITDDLNITRQ